MTGDVLVIGIGNAFRGDDGLGVWAARELRRRSLPGVTVVECSGEGAEVFELLRTGTHVLLIDAVNAGTGEGTAVRIDCHTSAVPHSLFRSSSHTFGVAEAIALARVLGEVPETLVLHGIEGSHFLAGTGLSDTAVRSMPHLLAGIERDCALMRSGTFTESDGVYT